MKRLSVIPLTVLALACHDAPTAPDGRLKKHEAPLASMGATSSAVHAWLGLKNNDDVGTKFDLRVEMLRNGLVVASSQLNAVPGGSSGFNNANLRSITSDFDAADSFEPGDTLGIRLSVRIAEGVAGHRSGTARLWYGSTEADSRADIVIGNTMVTYFLADAFALGSAAGTGAKKTLDVNVDRAKDGNAFKPFGTWTTTPPVPPRVIDVAASAISNSFLPGVETAVLAQWGDGSILVASAYPNTASYNVNVSGAGPVTWTPFALSGSRPSIWIPQGESYPEIAISGFGELRAQSQDNVTRWVNGDFGCCSQALGGFAIEPNVGIHWRIKGQVRTDLRTGLSSGGTYLVDLADTYITPDFIWEVPGGANFVRRRAWLSEDGAQMPLPAVHTIIPISQVQLHGALTAAMGYVHPTTEGGGYLSHFTTGGLAWSKVVPGVGAPVITGQDLVVAGSSDQNGNHLLALRLSDGSQAWEVPVPNRVQDLVVGDGGNLYVLLPNSMLVLDAVTGGLRTTYINMAFAVEMLLSNGTMFIVTDPPGQGTNLIVVPVASSNYDALSPWPVRFGDNQRTRNLPASRVR